LVFGGVCGGGGGWAGGGGRPQHWHSTTTTFRFGVAAGGFVFGQCASLVWTQRLSLGVHRACMQRYQPMFPLMLSPYLRCIQSGLDSYRYTNEVVYTNGSVVTVATRERPKLLFDPITNDLTHLVTGTCSAVTCPPIPPVNCKIVAWDYTLVQAIV
jgi:hypothetical protein